MPLVARVKELWENNTSQRDMLRILNEEDGFDIKERELMRVRAKNRWLLRVPNGMKSNSSGASARREDANTALQELEQAMYPRDGTQSATEAPSKEVMVPRAQSPELSPEVIAKRKERLEKLQAESADRWATRKRRRRTRGWAGLPADPPGPPRFPSETTIDESKQFLSLDAELYRQVRDHFQRICEDLGVIKKTIAGPDRWQAVKDRLIQESPHLQTVFWANNTQLDMKTLALDVVCTDVTKRMRTLERRMTIAEAKNVLGINPEESRQIRNAFYQTLKSDHFTSKIEAGDEHWKELKEQWIGSSELLQSILAPGNADPQHNSKVKAMEVLCRDVMKRLRDDQTKRDPSRRKSLPASSGISNGISTLASQALASAPASRNDYSDLQIDPSLLLAANDPSLTMGQQQHYQQQQQSPTSAAFASSSRHHGSSMSIPVYFRLSPLSQIQHATKLWLGTLTSGSVNELRQLAVSKHPDANLVRIEGVVRESNGNEVSFEIDEDDELGAYFAHVNGGKATFVVQLNGAYA